MSSNNSIRYIGNVKIIKNEYVLKEKKKDINYLYQFLSSKDFYSYPELLDESDKFYKFKYIEEERKPNYEDALTLLANLHKKTSEEKSTNKDNYEKVYIKLKENITHIKFYYESFITKIEERLFFSPSEYLFIRNLSKLLNMMKYCEDNIEKWYKLTENKNSQRVCLIHNNLKLNHTLIGKEKYLISFEDYTFDSPIIDLYKFYKNEDFNTEILDKFDIYQSINPLSNEEKILFNILVTLPTKIVLNDTEINNVKKVRKFIDLLYKTEEFVMKNTGKEETKNEL